MIIKIRDKLTEEDLSFAKKEWEFADNENFGKSINWEKKKIILEASEDNKMVGILEGTIQAGIMIIDDIIIAHDKQKQGVGKSLVKKAEEIARDYKIHKIFLITGKSWSAVKFYKALGYEKTGELINHYMKSDYIEFSKFLD